MVGFVAGLASWRRMEQRVAAKCRPVRMSVDFRTVSENVELFKKNVEDRKVNADVELVAKLYKEFRAVTTELTAIRTKRNENSAQMKKIKTMTNEEKQKCILEGKSLKEQTQELEEKSRDIQAQLTVEGIKLPNLTHPDVPVGPEENAAVLRTVGSKRNFDFPIKSHLDIGLDLDMFDFESAASVTGNKFYYLRNAGALLELALINWAMQNAVKNGFTPMTTPDLARESVVQGCGFQPRGPESQVYRIEETDLCLIGTAEIPLAGVYSGAILDKESLPIKMAAFSHCFRQEVGGAGSAVRGLYRVHQFSKVEMFVLSTPEQSNVLHNELRKIEEDLFESLGLHYKTLDMPTEDLGNPAYRKFDIEAWMPARGGCGAYGEISSASNCTDYQARRLNIRYREGSGDIRFAHTLNGTACAVPRIIVAILENFQQEDGTVVIPEVLRPYLGGMEVIQPPVKAKAPLQATAKGG
eukprot:Plantae.Rhodophyta-Purpureofilum_apyrenoidigerum.ctg4793.p1 GENE.Plantae.Rhodophyta-Purpureofilum_apyrenoidigerum.ctg4793~~Plantae.Rhodophyta-Purpureofilum_apyrenoidigerum.ctg4793.p1  ORF type:complete len:469 (-),score=75.15 Plantae.Rhodophyta-Purpureofilum_apyrenoidigerum.ctg4793:642-2048(-)